MGRSKQMLRFYCFPGEQGGCKWSLTRLQPCSLAASCLTNSRVLSRREVAFQQRQKRDKFLFQILSLSSSRGDNLLLFVVSSIIHPFCLCSVEAEPGISSERSFSFRIFDVRFVICIFEKYFCDDKARYYSCWADACVNRASEWQ